MSNNEQNLNIDLLNPTDLPNTKQNMLDTKSVTKLPMIIGLGFLALFVMVIIFAIINRHITQNRQLEIASKSVTISDTSKFAKQIIKQTSGLIEKTTDAIKVSSAPNQLAQFEYNTTTANNNKIITSADNLTTIQKQEVLNKLRELAKTDPNLAKMLEGLTDDEILQLVAEGKIAPIALSDGYVFGNKNNIISPNAQIITSADNLTTIQKQEVLNKLRELAKTDPNLAKMLEGLTDDEILQLVAEGKIAPIALSDGYVFGNKNNMTIQANPTPNPIINAGSQLFVQDKPNNLKAIDEVTASLKEKMQAQKANDIRRKYPNLSTFDDEALVAMEQAGQLESMSNSMQQFGLVKQTKNGDKNNLDNEELDDNLNSANGENEQEELRKQIKQMRLQMAQQALSAKTTVSFRAEPGKEDKFKNSTARFSQFGQIQTGNNQFNNKKPNTRSQIQSELKAVQAELNNQNNDIDMSDEEAYAKAQAIAQSLSGNNQFGIQQATNTTSINNSDNEDEQGFKVVKANFADQNQDKVDRWALGNTLQAPRSPYEMYAGTIIPATMITGINSDLPGVIFAQVSRNVYDTATGIHLLIPQGTKLYGAYTNDINFGQKRIMVAWQRLIFPDGKNLDIGEMPGSDQAGYSGLSDQVNNHYGRLFGSAFMMSGITAAITITQDGGGDNDKKGAGAALSESLGQVLGQTITQMIQKNLSIAPTLEIRPGYQFNVITIKDLTFNQPYKGFDYR